MRRSVRKAVFAGYATVACLAVGSALGVTLAPLTIGEQPDGSVLVSSHQRLTPVGTVKRLARSRPKALAVSPNGDLVALLATGQVLLCRTDGETVATIPGIDAGPLGICWSPDGKSVYASMNNGKIARIAVEGANVTRQEDRIVRIPGAPAGNPQVTGLAVSGDGKSLFAALGIRNTVAVLDTATGDFVREIPVGPAPYHVTLSPDGKTLAVACRGSRPTTDREAQARTAGTAVRIDPKTDASLGGTLALVDTATYGVRTVDAGQLPGGMAFSPDGKTLHIASANDDSLLIVAVTEGKVRKSVSVRPKEDPGFGQIPADVAVSSDGKRVYVACGGANAVAVLDAGSGRITGHVPTGWFPIAVRERQGTLFVASTKGIGSRAGKGVHDTVGTVQFIPPAAMTDLATLSRTVAGNNGWGKSEPPARKNLAPVPVPERVGEPSVFKHVIFIIKENQTYDGVFGDMKDANGNPIGNGDATLCTFPEEVTPNHHALARQYVLLDNTYTSGTNSADGHQWTVSGIANAYMEQNYGAHSRSYPYDGGDALAYSPRGFLWNAALASGKTVRVYGEFVNKPRVRHRETGKSGSFFEIYEDYRTGMKNYEITADTDNASLKPHLHPTYIGFPSIVPDQWRADRFIDDIDRFETAGAMPNLCILLLPNDHTMGTSRNVPTPRATVADNDLALGRIVERVSKSRFGKETLILVIEDDSQYGVDHVDGHRTVALCISPYTRRGQVVSEMYDHTSILRTIGLVLGIPAMNRFDRTATPMTACFTSTPDPTPYQALPNRIPLDERNPAPTALRGEARRLAEASERLDWSDVDRADAGIVSRAIWYSQFPNRPFPSAAYHPPTDEDENRAK
ncbi:MAG: bifunctional YncE family protein/alkaline phosphatase family protein [Capsulimonadales bacterium]|nr:bifunctional YncE family protein/alkaline phosphatase family protein [Capsulimonadales bacterium]